MYNLFPLLLASLLWASTLSSCGKGTLACSTTGKPMICDFFNSYLLDPSSLTCNQRQIENCSVPAIPNSSLACYLCKPGTVLDKESFKCVQVPAERLKENCEIYSSQSFNCIQCVKDYYISAEKCVFVGDAPVAQCAVHASKTKCLTCSSGTVLRSGTCQAFTPIQNCYLHRDIACHRCKDQHYLNPTANPKFNESSFVFGAFDFSLLVEKNANFAHWTADFHAQICQAGPIKNCKVYSSFAECEQCAEGYYKNSSLKCDREQEEPIEFCEEYKSATVCEKCKFKFYLNLGTGGCQPVTEVDSCQAYHVSENKCVLCNDRNYLSLSGNCLNERVVSLNMKSCHETAPNKDECLVCTTGYSLSTTKKACFPDITSCKTQVQSTGALAFHTCSQCEVNFHPSENKSQCDETKIQRCLEYALNQNVCSKCEDDHYFDSTAKVCAKQFVGSCSEFTPMTNTCTKCNNKFFLMNNTCTEIQLSQFCFESDGATNTCSKCLPQYLKSGNSCNVSVTREDGVIDRLCASNEDTVLNSGCTDCGVENFVLKGTVRAKPASYLLETNCALVEDTTGVCAQCAENSEGEDGKCKAPVAELTTDCSQLIKDEFIPLGNTKCAKCRDPVKHYLDTTTNSCRTRANITAGDSCEILPEDDSDCTLCKAEFFPVLKNWIRDQCFKQTDVPGYSVIPNCIVFDVSTLSCFVCRDDHRLATNKKSCILDNERVAVYFDLAMNLISPPDNPNPVQNCAVYHQLDLDVVRCAECKPGFVNIVRLAMVGEEDALFDFDSLGANLGFGMGSLPVEKCEPYLNSYQKEIGGPAIATDTCGVGTQIEGMAGYLCLRCKTGNIGAVEKMNKDSSGKGLGSIVLGMVNCKADASLKQSFYGLGYQYRFVKGLVPYSTFIHFTDCTTTTEKLIFNSKVLSDGSLELKQYRSSSGLKDVLYCAALSAINTPFIQTIPNCQIFAFTSDPPETHNSLSPPVDACLACTPGYKAVLDGGRLITKCEAIVNCMDLAINKIMNGCSLPKNGYALDTLENNHLIDFENLVPEDQLTLCQIVNSDGVTCIMCAKGYTVVNGKCQNTAVGIGSINYNCNSFGYGFNELTLDKSVNINQRMANYRFFLEFYNTFFIERKTVCSSCDTGFFVGIDTNSIKTTCEPIATIEVNLKIDNCLNYNLKTPVSCGKCKTGYIPNAFDGKCVPKSRYPNCVLASGHITITCKVCEAGFEVDAQNKCAPHNCKRFLAGKCSLCNDGFKHNNKNQLFCELNLDSLDPCSAYSPTRGTCGKCKNNQVLFIYYQKTATLETFQGFSCDPGNLIPENDAGWRDYNLDEVFIKVIFDTDSDTITSSLDFINHDTLTSRLFTNTDPRANPASHHCFPQRAVANCIADSLEAGVYCKKCENGFIIDAQTNSCILGSIPNCHVYKTATECEQCQPTHYLFSSHFCSPYTANINCLQIKPDKNECATCPENSFLNALKHCEIRRTDLNCDRFETSANKCTTCLEGFVLHSSTRTCIKRVAKFCEEVHLTLDKCTTCKPAHWMDTSGVCRTSSLLENCADYLPKKDGCLKCLANFYVSADGKKCKHKPDGIIGCRVYSDFGKCAGCKADHFLSNNSCLAVTSLKDNCLYYRSNGSCSQCASNYFLNLSSNQCVETEISNCQEFFSLTQCKLCQPGYVLTWSQNILECRAAQISHCIQAVGGYKNSCLKCEPNKVLSPNKRRCDSPDGSLPNCAVFASLTQCKECSLGYVRSKDWRQCEKRPPSTSTLSTNCLSEVTSTEIVCDLCKPGFKKDEKGECVSCGGNGCAICGSGLENCSLCQNPFFMNSSLKCVLASNSEAFASE